MYKLYPELIGIFVKSAPVIMTSNLSGNVSKQIVNGTKGILEGLYYSDKKEDEEAKRKIREARKKNESEVILLNPPDYIIITLLDNKTQKVRDKDTIPEDFNLLQDEDSRKIMIPVQNIIKNQVELEKVDIEYKDHPLELAFAFTVWKVQGLTFDKIILALEPLKGKNWTFENLYVAFSRITTINGIKSFSRI